MVAVGKLELLNKMINACFEHYANKNKVKNLKPVLLALNEVKFYTPVNANDCIVEPKFIHIMLQKVVLYKCVARLNGHIVAESMICFGEEQ